MWGIMQAFIFDVDDTLYDRSSPFEKAYLELYGSRFDIPVKELYWATTKRGDEVFEAAQTGRMEMDAAHVYRFQKGFADMGIMISDTEAMDFRHVYERKQNEIEISAGMRELLDFCKGQHVPMGIITNGTQEHQWRKIKQLGVEKWIPAQWIVISAACGIRKPDERIFRHMQEKMNLGECDFYYIGDSYANDIPGAVKAGWKSIWLNKQNAQIPQGAVKPDHIVKDEKELNSCIRSLLHK